jgi:hypothetical protein
MTWNCFGNYRRTLSTSHHLDSSKSLLSDYAFQRKLATCYGTHQKCTHSSSGVSWTIHSFVKVNACVQAMEGTYVLVHIV